ncbi:MAG: hypothetical protein Q8914_00485 [Bacteroidota bacterium]|nr:hypothetical protein [Bacteroidota bacterium]
MLRRKNAVAASASCLVLLTVSMLIPSCIDEQYDLAKGLSTEMNLGGDSLTIPLGSTDTIRLSDFLKPEDVSMLKTMENGGYGLNLKDSINIDVPKIDQNALKIEDKNFVQSQVVNFGDINLENFKIPAISTSQNVNLNLSAISLGNFNVPAISNNQTFPANMSGYAPTDLAINDISVSGGKNNIFSGINLPPFQGLPSVPIADPGAISFSSSNNVSYTINTPEGVSGIDNILLKDNPAATFSVSIELAGASDILTTGTINPVITINPSDLFVFNSLPGGNITFDESDSLTVANGFKQTKSYTIKKLDFSNGSGNPVDPVNNKLELTKAITSSGNIGMKGVWVKSSHINDVKNLNLIVKVSVNNVVIKSMDLNIPTINSYLSGNAAFTVDNSLPKEIYSINKVYFDENSRKLSFRLMANGLPTMISSSFKIDRLNITFPDAFDFEPAEGVSGHTYSLTDASFSPAEGKLIELYLKDLDMSNIQVADRRLLWNGDISYSGKVAFSGRINSANIPSASADTKMGLNIASDLGFKSADVYTNDVNKELPTVTIPITFNINIAKEVKRLNVLQLTPGTYLKIHIDKPSLPLKLKGNNLRIHFPDLLTFNPALPNNDYVINDSVPSLIELQLASLNINKDLELGLLTINDALSVAGGVTLANGFVNSSAIEGLSDKTMLVKATTPDMTIASTSIPLNTLAYNYASTQPISLHMENLPKEILSLDSIMLSSGAYLELSINVDNMPTLSNPLVADMTLAFPDLIRFSPGEADNLNQIHIKKPFANGKITQIIGLKGLHFDGKDLNGVLDINSPLKYNVGVSVVDPTVNSNELTSNPIKVTVDVGLKNIQFESVYGRVDPGIDPQIENIAISGLPDFMTKDDITLDITKPVIALKTESNLGIPIDIDMNMKPTRNGNVLASGIQSVQLSLPKANSIKTPTVTKFWISPDSAGMPQQYNFVESKIQNLFKTVPDNVNFTVNVSANTNEQHYINLNADYKMKVNYDVTVPFAFGKELQIVMRDTIDDLDASIGKMAAGHTLELMGTLENSIPLELELELIPLNGDYAPLDIVPALQTIDAGTKDGKASMTKLDVKLDDPDGHLKELRGFELVFKATSNETVAGTPIKPSNYVKATLKAKIGGGISIGNEN